MSTKVSGIASSGNYTYSNRGRQTPIQDTADTFEQELSIGAKMAQLTHYSYYILSHNLNCRFVADEITDNLKQLPYMQRAVLFFVYGMDLSVKYAARHKLHLSTAQTYRLLMQAEDSYKEILVREQETY